MDRQGYCFFALALPTHIHPRFSSDGVSETVFEWGCYPLLARIFPPFSPSKEQREGICVHGWESSISLVIAPFMLV